MLASAVAIKTEISTLHATLSFTLSFLVLNVHLGFRALQLFMASSLVSFCMLIVCFSFQNVEHGIKRFVGTKHYLLQVFTKRKFLNITTHQVRKPFLAFCTGDAGKPKDLMGGKFIIF